MAPVPSLRSRSTVQEHTRVAGFAVRVTASSRGVVLDNDGMAIRHTMLVSRASVSVGQRNIILGSVLGCIGLIALVGLVSLLVWYWKGRRDSSEEMIIEPPTQALQNTQDPSTYENTVFSTPIQNFIPPPGASHTLERTYIPNHPYAKTYARMSVPPTPPLEGATVFETQHPRLSPLTMPHPYTQSSHSERHKRVASGQPSTVYESFMSPESGTATPEPQNEPMEPSPLASTVGGALSHHVAPFDTVLSTTLSEELPSSMSASSSAPLQPDSKRPHR